MTIKALKNSAPEADQTQSELNDVVQESTAQAAQTISAHGDDRLRMGEFGNADD